jgi:hypothetical protein
MDFSILRCAGVTEDGQLVGMISVRDPMVRLANCLQQ